MIFKRIIDKRKLKKRSNQLKKHCDNFSFIKKTNLSHFYFGDNSFISVSNTVEFDRDSMIDSGRTSIIRLDKNSQFILNGCNSFFYGADIRLFADSILSIGKGTYINCNCKLRVHKSIKIGSNCSISHNVTIMDGDGHEINGIRKVQPVVIEDGVLICSGAIILKGVHIGKGSIVGAGAVVTKDIPEFCLACGVPAKIIKRNITHD